LIFSVIKVIVYDFAMRCIDQIKGKGSLQHSRALVADAYNPTQEDHDLKRAQANSL
jgi:hypothetical protein